MKKEYLILTALILILGAYVLFHKENRDHTNLPEIKKIDTSGVTEIILDKKDGPIRLTGKGDAWTLTDKAYPANLSAVKNILDTLKTFKLSALVSGKGDLNRYELDEGGRIRVRVMAGEKVVFELSMGKTAPTGNHTFVMIGNDQNVYHADGSFRPYFDKSVAEFRDKKVVEFKQESIRKITIGKGETFKIFSLTKKSAPAPKDQTDKKDKTGKKDEPRVSWNDENGIPADKEVIESLLSSLSFLECDDYLNDSGKDELKDATPLCLIRLENDTVIEVKLFPAETEDRFTGISSMNPYAFFLDQYTGKDMVSDIETLLGLTGSKENKE